VAILGKQGLRTVGELSTAKAHYAAETLGQVPGVQLRYRAPFFKEFALELPSSPERAVRRLLRDHILAGIPLRRFDRTWKNTLLVAVTEKRTREEIDAYAAALGRAVASTGGRRRP
jgi:glycine dehydrogenase subunit 1